MTQAGRVKGMISMWIVGKLRGEFFSPLPESPRFNSADEAEKWAGAYLKDHPEPLQRGLESLTWRQNHTIR